MKRHLAIVLIVLLGTGISLELTPSAALAQYSTSRNPGDYHAAVASQNAYPTRRPGECYRFVIQFRNTGAATWHRGVVNLATDRPQDRVPGFIREDRCTGQPSGWVSPNRISLQENTVPPGGIGTFVFAYTITADHAAGTFREYFRPVADGITWMEDCGCYWDVTVVRQDPPRLPVIEPAPQPAPRSAPQPDPQPAPPAPAPRPRSGDPCSQYYGQGYCTDYVRQRMNVPWRGNAITWFDQAASHGWRTGPEPRVGAIAVFAVSSVGHVAWVDWVSPDGRSFVVSQWNYGRGLRPGSPPECVVTTAFGTTTTTTWNAHDHRIRGFIYGP
jgi:surface antigen